MKSKQNIKIIRISAAIAVSVLLFSCQNEQSTRQVTQLQFEKDSLVTIINERDSLMNEMIEAFNQIEKDLTYIREQRNLISVTSDDTELGQSKKDKIVQDVKDLATLLEESRKRINTLNKKLKASGVKVASLEKRMSELEVDLKTRNTEIIALTDELEQKNYEVSVLNDQIQALETTNLEQEMRIQVQEDEINDFNTAFYAQGTSKELTEKGVITKVGGFLGLGRTKTISDNINENDFEVIDIRETKQIPVYSDKVSLITEHPNGSYEIISDTNQTTVLAINNPDEFYKYSRYVVLEVEK